MRRRHSQCLGLAIIALLLLPACIVRSVHSWVQDDSVVFEDDLLGGWTGAANNGDTVAMTFVRGAGNTYIVQYSDKDSHGIFEGKLAKFGADYFMDFRPKETAHGVDGMLLFPTHTAARLEIGPSRLTVVPLNYDAMKSAAQKDGLPDLKYAWEENELIITSGSSDLQRFLLGLGPDSDLFAEPIRLTRKK